MDRVQAGWLVRFSQLSIFTILNLINVEVLIKIRIATSHCLCDAWNIWAAKTHPYHWTVRCIPALGFMRRQMIRSKWTPRLKKKYFFFEGVSVDSFEGGVCQREGIYYGYYSLTFVLFMLSSNKFHQLIAASNVLVTASQKQIQTYNKHFVMWMQEY